MTVPKYRRVLLKISGEALMGPANYGIDVATVGALLDAGVAAVDLAGAGGTSWSEVERHRLGGGVAARVAGAFAGWGIPTARALAADRSPHRIAQSRRAAHRTHCGIAPGSRDRDRRSLPRWP